MRFLFKLKFQICLLCFSIANWSPKIGEQKVAEGMRRAFDEWAKYGNLKFERVFYPGADIVVAFGNRYHGDYFPFDGKLFRLQKLYFQIHYFS